jgi:hypothetical protein
VVDLRDCEESTEGEKNRRILLNGQVRALANDKVTIPAASQRSVG